MVETKQIQVTSLKPGRYVVLDGVACKVTKMDISRPGKHGHAKCKVEAVGVINGEKKVTVLPGHDKIESPLIEKKSAQVLSVHEDNASIMDETNFETFDLKIPAELKGQVEAGKKVVYWVVLDDKVMKEVKNG
ncbi:MAG: translation initiation factor IF-5A [Nanoarchaeota archaeon]|mgnify:CR=1 FL=1|jgi:translation initiation factor 5A|nr:translation initiation factor IF-5A [Nanoarchaeota archaeon]|tara:strand:- start:6233 stop:6631 length:399 start_codon:yes stop_codon:yes gene_type:complete